MPVVALRILWKPSQTHTYIISKLSVIFERPMLPISVGFVLLLLDNTQHTWHSPYVRKMRCELTNILFCYQHQGWKQFKQIPGICSKFPSKSVFFYKCLEILGRKEQKYPSNYQFSLKIVQFL